jgi:hypothetical protein
VWKHPLLRLTDDLCGLFCLSLPLDAIQWLASRKETLRHDGEEHVEGGCWANVLTRAGVWPTIEQTIAALDAEAPETLHELQRGGSPEMRIEEVFTPGDYIPIHIHAYLYLYPYLYLYLYLYLYIYISISISLYLYISISI